MKIPFIVLNILCFLPCQGMYLTTGNDPDMQYLRMPPDFLVDADGRRWKDIVPPHARERVEYYQSDQYIENVNYDINHSWARYCDAQKKHAADISSTIKACLFLAVLCPASVKFAMLIDTGAKDLLFTASARKRRIFCSLPLLYPQILYS